MMWCTQSNHQDARQKLILIQANFSMLSKKQRKKSLTGMSLWNRQILKTMLTLTSSKPSLKVVNDQTGTPTYALDLALAIFDIIENRKAASNEGLYHYSNQGECTWYEFARTIAAYSGNTECKINPCTSEEYPSPVRRPSYSVLDKTRIKKAFGMSVPHWTDSLKKCLNNI